jgi:hypothetical protein
VSDQGPTLKNLSAGLRLESAITRREKMKPGAPPPMEPVNPDAVREQLKRLLEHHVLKGSRRCAGLLEYLVEYRLRGGTTSPKERAIGVTVFDRESDYDTANDPVVRGAANETRKRIAQYYLEPGHENELRFDLPTGSYMLEFSMPKEAEKPQSIHNPPVARRRIPFYYLILPSLFLVMCALGIIWLRRPSALDRFWSPILDSSNRVLVCVLRTSTARTDVRLDAKAGGFPTGIDSALGIPFVGLPDNSALIDIIHFLDSKKVKHEVRYQTLSGELPSDQIKPGLDELRKGPSIFVGGSDWTNRLLPSMRFHKEGDPVAGILYVKDEQNPSNKKWSLKLGLPFGDYTEDYAIISRIFDSMTGQVLLVVVGVGLHGTAPAGEFVTDASLMNEVAPSNSAEWKKRNVQIVIHMKIAGDAWGSPQLVAKHFW